MRLWHVNLLEELPRQQLLGQHRECCALRGKGWGKKQSTVDYVFKYPKFKLFNYHSKVMKEMERRGYRPDSIWKSCHYRGKKLGYDSSVSKEVDTVDYIEHNDDYYLECLYNLEGKGIKL